MGARHLIRSSSTPPAVVTTAETWRCWTRKRSVSRRPDEMRLDVYPRKMVVRSPVSGCRYARCLDQHPLCKYISTLTREAEKRNK